MEKSEIKSEIGKCKILSQTVNFEIDVIKLSLTIR